MKKILLLSLFAVGISNLSFAQNQAVASQNSTAAVSIRTQTDQMSKELGLSAEQTKRLYEVNNVIASKSAGADVMSDAKKASEAAERINKYRSEQYQSIFTKEQYQKWVNKTQGSRKSR